MLKNKIYFASDQHFGAPNRAESLKRERLFIQWLDEIKQDAKILFLLGDLFDFWFEYKQVIPKGFIRVQAKLAELTDEGVEVHLFAGNHDLWLGDYLEKEIGVKIHHQPKEFNLNNKRFLIGHGDGLGPGDKGYKRLKKVFTNTLSKFLFRWLHPDWGMKLGIYLSLKNKLISGNEEASFLGEDKEWLVLFCKEQLEIKSYDYFVFGHRHLPLQIKLEKNATYLNTGDWLKNNSFACFDGEEIHLRFYKKNIMA